MFSFLKTKKSAGVAVTPATHRLIDIGNRARGNGDWDDAAEAYRKALNADPSLAHIWMQLGHAEKERNRVGDAEAAYVRASILRPDSAEPLLHLGHIYKTSGNLPGALRAYLTAARHQPSNPHALEELRRLIGDSSAATRADLSLFMRGELLGETEAGPAATIGNGALLLDISSLVSAALGGRNFNEMGLSAHRLAPTLAAQADRPARMCAHVVGHGRWLTISAAQYARLAALGQDGGTGPIARQVAISELELSFLISDPLVLPEDAVLIGLDADHAPIDHYLFVQAARAQAGARYIACGQTIDAALANQADRRIEIAGPDLTAEAVRDAVAATASATVPAASVDEIQPGRLMSLGGVSSFRTGTGWLPQESWGCWATMPGGEFAMRVPALEQPRLYLQLRGLPAALTNFQVRLTDGRRIQGEVAKSGFTWIVIDDLPVEDGMVRISVRSDQSTLVPVEGMARRLPAMIGVAGFMVCGRDDRAARLQLLEAVTLGSTDELRQG